MRASAFAIVLLLAVMGGTPPAHGAGCPGDLDGDGQVTITEIITMVSAAISGCTAGCPGDLDGDGMVTVDEIIKAVNAALVGCPMGPTPTPTPVEQCPYTFQDDTLSLGVSCAYAGPFSENLTCADNLSALLLGDGSLVAVTIGSDPLITLGGVATSPTTAALVAYFVGDDLTPQPLSGVMELADGGDVLILDPDTVPDFNLGGTQCSFDRYRGTFTGLVTDRAAR
jgi:hypothetical protein